MEFDPKNDYELRNPPKVTKFSEKRFHRLAQICHGPVDMRAMTDFNIDHNLGNDKLKFNR